MLTDSKLLFVIFLILLVLVIVALFQNWNFASKQISVSPNKFNITTPSPSPSPTPTPRPLTFAEMNALYGPCVRLPVLMYHHIQTKEAAVAAKQTGLTVDTDYFKSQMQYLKDRGYNAATMQDLINFFDNGTPVPGKSVLITLDDGYEDNFTDAYPILQSVGFHATIFTPTGLMDNPGYLTWSQISGMNGLILFANHTWSHKNVQVTSAMQYEISTADTQLSEHGLNVPKVFAYPYGLDTVNSENYLNSLGYKVAFSTVPGSILCKKQRFELPRIRVGNSPLSNYGF